MESRLAVSVREAALVTCTSHRTGVRRRQGGGHDGHSAARRRCEERQDLGADSLELHASVRRQDEDEGSDPAGSMQAIEAGDRGHAACWRTGDEAGGSRTREDQDARRRSDWSDFQPITASYIEIWDADTRSLDKPVLK